MELDATKAFELQALNIQESKFLEAFGWVRLPNNKWKPPPGYLKHKGVKVGNEHLYDKGHAVNSQKWVNRNRL